MLLSPGWFLLTGLAAGQPLLRWCAGALARSYPLLFTPHAHSAGLSFGYSGDRNVFDDESLVQSHAMTQIRRLSMQTENTSSMAAAPFFWPGCL